MAACRARGATSSAGPLGGASVPPEATTGGTMALARMAHSPIEWPEIAFFSESSCGKVALTTDGSSDVTYEYIL